MTTKNMSNLLIIGEQWLIPIRSLLRRDFTNHDDESYWSLFRGAQNHMTKPKLRVANLRFAPRQGRRLR